jgi:hypothetical protein
MKTLLAHPANTRTETIVRELRERIVRGELSPGSQLPTWGELERRYDVTRTTLNRVLGRLKDDGFVFASSTRGTFVTQRPPHLFRYALCFIQRPDDPGWNRFWWTLAKEAVVLEGAGDRSIPCFYGVEDHADNDAHNRLLHEAAADRLAGLILAGTPDMISASLRERADLPKVGLWSEDTPIPSVYIDQQSFIDKSLDYLASRGRRRVAVITTPVEPFDAFPAAAAARGMEHKPYWRLAAAVDWPETVRPIVQLLFSAPPDQRPDALVIADDNLVADTVAALMATGVRVPDELEIVMHCNWPQPVRSVLPVQRLGFNARQVLEQAIQIIDRQRRGEPVAKQTLVPALFEHELRAN